MGLNLCVMSIVTTFAFNNAYYKYASLLCKTLYDNNNHDAYIRCVNVDIVRLDSLRKKYPCYTFVDDRRKLNTEKTYTKNEIDYRSQTTSSIIFDKNYRSLYLKNRHKNDTDIKKYSEEAVYTCHSRFKNISEILEQDIFNTIVVIDVDTIVNKPLACIEEYMNGYDIAVHIDNNGDYTEEGCFFLKNNERIKNYINDVYNTVMKDCNNWDIDGQAMRQCMTSTIKIKQLDINKFKNKNFQKDAIMWSGDSNVKNNAYYKEML